MEDGSAHRSLTDYRDERNGVSAVMWLRGVENRPTDEGIEQLGESLRSTTEPREQHEEAA